MKLTDALKQKLAGLRSNSISEVRDRAERDAEFVPPGHFYSALPSLAEVKRDEKRIFDRSGKEVHGIDLREADQFALFDIFASFYNDLPWSAERSESLRYFYDNPSYSYFDAIILYSFLRYLKPKRFIEVGSGYSSCVVLDTDDLFLDGNIEMTCVEPYPELLLSLLKDEDKERVKVRGERVQGIDLDVFRQLAAGDILFIDSTHVSKVGSDVNKLFFEVLPVLAKGVYIHIHDVFYPFEYPEGWIYEGRAWTEDYVLRAFLQYNTTFQIEFFNNYLAHFHFEKLATAMPLFAKNPGGSIWLKKIL
jgi:hypothetical protein